MSQEAISGYGGLFDGNIAAASDVEAIAPLSSISDEPFPRVCESAYSVLAVTDDLRHWRGKTLKDLVPCKNLVDVNWWDSKSLILSRCTGAVTVSSTKTLKNLLGTSPEWFEPSSRVTGVHHDGFLGLEVECVFPQKRRLGDTSEEEFEDSDDEETSFVSKTTKLTKDVLYYVTDMERFQPPRKRPKIINRTYRLVCLKSTTPEELYTRKIDHEEYGEALELAKAYGLDTDRVYQRQWKKSDVSIASIQDYLSKIKKRSWVFHECIERIPYNIDAMRELLEFGLKGTDLQALLAIEKGEDGGSSYMLHEDIDHEEYGEALELAKAYGLDTDRVYQRQWKKSDVSIASIQDYLSKIKKRSWVFHECIERIPYNIDAMRELLEFGLKGTDLQALLAIEKGEDGGRFILCDPEDGLYEDITLDEFDPETQTKKEELKKAKQEEMLNELEFKNLNLEQREVCRVRRKLLQYLYRLKTYECILGGVHAAAERFNEKFFQKFRSANIVEIAVNYARDNNIEALETLFTFHWEDLRPHRLGILSNFPETTNPHEYRSLLPEVGNDKSVIPWEEDRWREKDWSEEDFCRTIIEPVLPDLGGFLYEENPGLKEFRMANPNTDDLSKWYSFRACEIERLSRQVDLSVELVKLATERGVEGLSELLDNLVTMEMLVYDCYVDENLTFDELQKMADYDKLELIMSKASTEMYTKCLHKWLVPFLQQCEHRQPGTFTSLLRDYIVTKAKTDLTLPTKIFEASKATQKRPIISSQDDVMSIALEALYVCGRDDQLDLALEIFQCLPQKGYGKETKESIRLHKEIDKLERHLGALKILHEQDVKKPLHYILETEKDADDAKMLMIRLTRAAGKRSEPLSEIAWRKLHDDVIQLQNQVYRCLSSGLCHEIFTESLLCSGRRESITLAGEYIERSNNESLPTQSYTKNLKVSYKRAIQLVISSAQEYFDSSTDMKDPCIDLARICLNLIRDTPTLIQEELDLINSLAMLDDFGVSIIPAQVRQTKDRIELIEKCLSTRDTSYKQQKKLMRLSHLLKIEKGNNSLREGKVLHFIARGAVKAHDCCFAYEVCQDLIERMHGPVWDVCVDLASFEDFKDISAKADLLSFSLAYCPADMIEPILQAKAVLETQMLYSTIHTDMEVDDKSSERAPLSATAALQHTTEILSSTTKTTKAVLSTVADTKWWQKTIKSLKQPTRRQVSETVVYDNDKFEKQGCHPFYEEFITSSHPDYAVVDYTRGKSACSPTALSESILRTAKLEEMLTEGETTQSSPEVLLDLAKTKFPVDSSLGLAYLLALPDTKDVEKFFDDFPKTAITQQLTLYYYALQIYASVKPTAIPQPSPLYRLDPVKLIQRVINFVTNRDDLDWPQDVLDLVEKLKKCYESFEDYVQARTLVRIGSGVDIQRFTDDPEYKKETILGLTMSVNDEMYNVACNLAERYGIPLWELYMSHLEFLFDSGLAIEEIEERVNNKNIVPTLISQPEEFAERMRTSIYPDLDGTDHTTLIYYFTLLAGVGDVKQGGITADNHLKLLKKIKGVAIGLDCKQLMNGLNSPVKYIIPVLTPTNVTAIAKLANKIPDGTGGFLHPSVVHCAWAVKQFWSTDTKKVPDSTAAWVHRYEGSGESLQKLLPVDVINFIDEIVFSEQSRLKLEVECRQEIVKRTLKFTKQHGGKKKKQDDSGCRISWEDAANTLLQYLNHIENLNHESFKSLSMSGDDMLVEYAAKFDLSKGDNLQMQKLYCDMIENGYTVELIEDILEVFPVSPWTPHTALKEAVGHLIQLLRDPNELDKKQILVRLEKVVLNVEEHQNQGGNLVSSEDVMVLLRPFCSDDRVAVQPRLDVLHMVEKSFQLSEEDLVLLTLYRTEAVVKATWSDTQLKEGDINTDKARYQLFLQLLSKSSNYNHFNSICDLLQLWPPLKAASSSDHEQNVWVNIFCAMINTSDSKTVSLVVTKFRTICDSVKLGIKCVRHVYNKMIEKKYTIEGVKFVLLSTHKDMLSAAVTELAALDEAKDDEELFDLLLKRSLLPQIVNTVYYKPVIGYLLVNQNVEEQSHDNMLLKTVANQLNDNGFKAEAGSLMLQSRSAHSMLQTFGSALGAVGKWLKH
ncbi:NBAS subunit of NRZ tethering complex-like [Mytilus galloprovincialis]|uniref:NBAS subunit of NRZ tethering complex-like n=1 Tax=Mytilus galloprovincialis TaxID=29158 RepID=UPI003F7CB309